MNNIKKYKRIQTLLVVVLTGFTCLASYYIISCDVEIDFNINWNMFKSVLLSPLLVVGFILGLGVKFQEYIPMTKITRPDGSEEHKRDLDIINNMEAGCVIPLLQYLVFYPVMIAAAIYYSLMGVIYLFGAIFPFLIVAFLIVTLVLFHKWENKLIIKRSRLWSMPLVSSFFVGSIYLLYLLWVPFYEASIPWVGWIALGIILATLVLFVAVAIREYRQGPSADADGSTDAAYKPSVISRKFLIIYILSLLFIVAIYSYKSNSTYSSVRPDETSVQKDIHYQECSLNKQIINY
jgi:hypothetical protein